LALLIHITIPATPILDSIASPLKMPSEEACSGKAAQDTETLQGIGSWLEPQGKPPNQSRNKDISKIILKNQDQKQKQKEAVKQHLSKQSMSETWLASQTPPCTTAERPHGIRESRYSEIRSFCNTLKAHVLSVSPETSNLQHWLSEPDHEQPWNAASRLHFIEGDATKLWKRL
jgi:hypothetical protein